MKVKEHFIVTGDETLEMLGCCIQGCDGVIHLAGGVTGTMAKPQSTDAFSVSYPELVSHFPALVEFQQLEANH
jgi:hypothetical protein